MASGTQAVIPRISSHFRRSRDSVRSFEDVAAARKGALWTLLKMVLQQMIEGDVHAASRALVSSREDGPLTTTRRRIPVFRGYLTCIAPDACIVADQCTQCAAMYLGRAKTAAASLTSVSTSARASEATFELRHSNRSSCSSRRSGDFDSCVLRCVHSIHARRRGMARQRRILLLETAGCGSSGRVRPVAM